jgi:hypothetical protein
MQDAQRFLKEIEDDVNEQSQLLKKQQKMLGASLAAIRVTAADTVFNLSPSSEKNQRSLIRKLKHNVDPELDKVVVPNLKKLESQYNLAEDFYEKLKGIEQAETQVQMTFHNRRGPEYNALMTQFKTLKTKVQNALKDCLQFLSDVAQKHVPPGFQKYIDMVVEQVNEHVICRDSSTFMYVSVDPNGNLVFTAYILLQDVANDEGAVAPHLYISVQWLLGKENEVRVDLNHEYEVPNKLLGQGEPVGSVGEAAKAINELLELENFSSTLGVVPLAIQLNVDPTTIKLSQFKYGDVIDKLSVGEHSMKFVLRSEINNSDSITEIAYQIYKELKVLMKRGKVKLSMTTEKVGKQTQLEFHIVKIAEGGEFNQFDLEFLRDKFDLNNTQLRKIVNIING